MHFNSSSPSCILPFPPLSHVQQSPSTRLSSIPPAQLPGWEPLKSQTPELLWAEASWGKAAHREEVTPSHVGVLV